MSSLVIYNEKTGQVSMKLADDSGVIRYENLYISSADNMDKIGSFDFCLAKTSSDDMENSIEFLGSTFLTANLGSWILISLEGGEAKRTKINARYNNIESMWLIFETEDMTLKFIPGSLIGQYDSIILVATHDRTLTQKRYVFDKFW